MKYVTEMEEAFIGIYSVKNLDFQVHSDGIDYYAGEVHKSFVTISPWPDSMTNKVVDVEESNIHDSLSQACKAFEKMLEKRWDLNFSSLEKAKKEIFMACLEGSK
jgi:hypothetical protein